jgi:predicted small lipoprotein YifL
MTSRLPILVAVLGALSLSACGLEGHLDRPAPRRDADDRATRRAERDAVNRAKAQKSCDAAATSQTNCDYTQASDGAKDPALRPMRADPIPGISNPFGTKSGGVLPDPYNDPNRAPR